MSSKGAAASLIPELFRFGLYKPTQGRMVRQVTFLAIAMVVAFGCFSLSVGLLGGQTQPIRVGVPLAVGLAVCWVAFRVVNIPQFADFLISVESELEKVVWPGRKQVMQSTVVVIVTMLFLGLFLFGVDLVWRWFFSLINFIDYE
ncbi:preprotein translocase subunit SecE [Fuerstiella marisgermanici]|uniref:Protein translocase subunit SecE n=1 Tax=Fuerstiella marisgermanici TaxID=1891926 RepID=A0A1P8WPU4_9PLAN|nr:preprotein translocase subunit SecE [Fuerstiella marisgermanici]APZ96070.1 Preprotein translocase subunit SecE [Fuerstiella marisgermanici]